MSCVYSTHSKPAGITGRTSNERKPASLTRKPAKHQAIEIYKNLINPAIAEHAKKTSEESDAVEEEPETGYKSSERVALENQLMQIETVAQVIEEQEENPSVETYAE